MNLLSEGVEVCVEQNYHIGCLEDIGEVRFDLLTVDNFVDNSIAYEFYNTYDGMLSGFSVGKSKLDRNKKCVLVKQNFVCSIVRVIGSQMCLTIVSVRWDLMVVECVVEDHKQGFKLRLRPMRSAISV